MKAGLKVDGVEQVVAAVVDHAGKIQPGVKEVLKEAGKRIKKKQQQAAPKKTGRLRRSISIRSRGTKWKRSVSVGPRWSTTSKGQAVDTKYAFFQEFGTSRMKAHPYVAPSLVGENERVARELNKLISLK